MSFKELISYCSFYIWYFEYHRRDFLTKAKGIDVELESVRKKQQSMVNSKRLIHYYFQVYYFFCSLIIMQLYRHSVECHGFNGNGLHVHKSDVVYVPSSGSN